MKTLNERLEGFKQVKLTPVQRGGQSYAETEVFVRRGLKLCVWSYKKLTTMNQTARLLRDVIDFLLRRYHGYCIKEHTGGHYREVGLKPGDKTDFEHVLPAAIVRELLIVGRITVEEAMNPPTCVLRKANHKKLNASKATGSQTPSIVNFWQRYQLVLPKVQIETHDGTKVDLTTWDLNKHYEYFGVTNE